MLNVHDVPSVNAACLNCTRPDCPGFCEELRASLAPDEKNVQTLQWRGYIRTISEWAEILGVSRATLYRRINKGMSVDEILEPTNSDNSTIPGDLIEEIYIRLSHMHADYLVFWDRPGGISDSAGMVTNYNKVQVSPTNKVGSIVEQRAIPEIMMSEDANTRKAWIACVLDVIKMYRKGQYNHRGYRMKANILEWRAIDGLTVSRIADRINEEIYRPITINKVRNQMAAIVNDIAREAMLRGLHRHCS